MDEFWKVLMKLCEAGGVSSFILEADKEIAYYHDGSLRQAPLTTPQAAVDHILNAVKRSKDVPNSDIDRSFTYEKFRFRVNAYMSRGIRKMVLRLLPVSVMEFAKLGLPSRAAERILSLDRGLVLVAGPTGSGKTTTVASILNRLAPKVDGHIVTLEDPIENLIAKGTEYEYRVSQREVGDDVPTFALGLRSALRQEPKIIFCGEVRDFETAELVLQASLTGHLVFATLHTNEAAYTLSRFTDLFPPEQHENVRATLAATVQAVVCQLLEKKASGKGRVALHEILLRTTASSAHIRAGTWNKLRDEIEMGRSVGNQSFRHAFREAENSGLIATVHGRFEDTRSKPQL